MPIIYAKAQTFRRDDAVLETLDGGGAGRAASLGMKFLREDQQQRRHQQRCVDKIF
jgi:hypothetical protein